MATAHPVELEEALRKVAKREALTRDERQLVLHTLDEIPEVPQTDEQKVRRLLGVADGEPLPVNVLDELAWRQTNVDNRDPVLRAIARAPIDDEPMLPEERAELDHDLADIRAGRARLTPHAEVERELERRRHAMSL